MARVFQAYGLSYPLRGECPLELEDVRKLLTLAKLEKQSQETALALQGITDGAQMRKLAEGLQRQEVNARRLRIELKSILN